MGENENARNFLKDFYEELKLNINDIENKDLDFKSILDDKIKDTTNIFLERTNDFSDKGLEETFRKEVEHYENTPVKYVDEIEKEKLEVFEKFREHKEELLKNGLDDNIKIIPEDFSKNTFYDFTERDIKILKSDYDHKNEIFVNDETYSKNLYNDNFFKKYEPLNIIDEHSEIKTEILEKLVKEYDLKNELPEFQVYLDSNMRYDSKSNKIEYSDINDYGEEIWKNEWYSDVSDDWEEYSVDDIIGNRIREAKGEEYWDNMDIKDIREYENISDNIVFIYSDEKNYKNEKAYTGYEDYLEFSVKKALELKIKEEPKIYKDVEKTVEKIVEEKGLNKEKSNDKEFEKDDINKEKSNDKEMEM